MSDNSKEIVERLKTYFVRLTRDCSRLEERCRVLEKENERLQKSLSQERDARQQLAIELTTCKKQYQKLQMSQQTELNIVLSRENKERFAKLVREIDKCISLLQA